jgi:hypothetical protein
MFEIGWPLCAKADGTYLTGIEYIHIDTIPIDDGEYLAFFWRYRSHAPT